MGENSAPKSEFNVLLVRSIDETIESLLGKGVVEPLHDHLLRFRSISIEETPDHLDVLTSVFEKFFGASARTISKAIARRLFSKLDLEFRPRGGMALVDYVEEAKLHASATDIRRS